MTNEKPETVNNTLLSRSMAKLTPLRVISLFLACEWIFIVAFHFPYAKDQSSPDKRLQKTIDFYDQAYQPAATDSETISKELTPYERVAKAAAEAYRVEDQVKDFAERYNLKAKRVLEVGAGRGYLQDVVPDYTALDISPSARRYFHKPFVRASATAMPFKDREFDAIWTIWVLEHVPGPEDALLEMRRVLKDGAVLFLAPAWNCTPWAADGYEVRPYEDFGWGGKLIKTSLVLRRSPAFIGAYTYPIRAMRYAGWRMTGSPMPLRYRRLIPNYAKYWQPDSDAVNSIDGYEAYLWFRSRGDECLNCDGDLAELKGYPKWPLIIRSRLKPATSMRHWSGASQALRSGRQRIIAAIGSPSPRSNR